MSQTPSNSSPTVAVALGGGGARGLAHIHIVEALDELGIVPVAITGSSIGSVIGSGWAAGMSGAEIREFSLATLGNSREVMNRLWSLRPTTVREMMSGGMRFGQFNLERILGAFLPDALPNVFEELKIPLGVTATDYYGQREVLIETGDLLPAIAASAAIPAVFMPVTVHGTIMIDGGIYNPVPFDYLRDRADIVIGIDVVGPPAGEIGTVPSRIDSLFGASQLMMHSITAMKLKSHKPDIFLRPDVGSFKVLDFLKAREVLDVSAGVKDDLKKALDAAIAFRQNGAIPADS